MINFYPGLIEEVVATKFIIVLLSATIYRKVTQVMAIVKRLVEHEYECDDHSGGHSLEIDYM